MTPFGCSVSMYGGDWRRHICKRAGHHPIVALTISLELHVVCIRCGSAGDLPGLAVTFTTTHTDTTPERRG